MTRDSGTVPASHLVSKRDWDTATDEELIASALLHREEAEGGRAVSALLERYQDRIYLWCLHMLRDRERALDAAQEVLIAAYRRLDTFERRSGFSSWLFVITRNRCLSELRRARRPQDVEDLLASCPDPRPAPDQVLEEKREQERILNLIRARLDPVEQQALWLRCFEGVAVEEIGRLLRLDKSSGARALLQRVRRKLRADTPSSESAKLARHRPSGPRGRSVPERKDTP